jgi:hypothetical protein
MIGQGFPQVIPEEPANAESICRMPHQLAFRVYSFKEHDQLQFEKMIELMLS